MKKSKRILLILVLVAALLILGKNAVARAAISSGLRVVTGLNLEIRSMAVGVFRPVVEVKGARLFNPSGFPDRVMVDLPELFLRYDPGALLGGKVHLENVRIHLEKKNE